MVVDIVVGLQHGDEGKGKVVNQYLKDGDYDYCIKFNGGPNAGHSVELEDGTKVVTHQVPIGVIYGVKSIIGCGCVVSILELEREIKYLTDLGFDVEKYLQIDENAHAILGKHIDQDRESSEGRLGTTGS